MRDKHGYYSEYLASGIWGPDVNESTLHDSTKYGMSDWLTDTFWMECHCGIKSLRLIIGPISMMSYFLNIGRFLPLWYHCLWRAQKFWRVWVVSLVGVNNDQSVLDKIWKSVSTTTVQHWLKLGIDLDTVNILNFAAFKFRGFGSFFFSCA